MADLISKKAVDTWSLGIGITAVALFLGGSISGRESVVMDYLMWVSFAMLAVNILNCLRSAPKGEAGDQVH